MATEIDWPTTRWQLSAPESFVLLNGPASNAAEAFKMALLELVSRGSLKLIQTRKKAVFGRGKDVSVLTHGGKTLGNEPALEPLQHIFQTLPTEQYVDGTAGVPVERFAKAVRQKYGTLAGYVGREVLPALVQRGLYEQKTKRFLFLFPSTQWLITPRGEEARAELETWMRTGQERFGGWVASDPRRALSYAGLAGASLLLMAPLYPDLQLLGQSMRNPGGLTGTYADGGTASSDWDTHDVPAGGDEAWNVDLGAAFSGFDPNALSFDFSAFDSIDSTFAAIDSGVDSGGGSDSGGGDSGGGGDGGGGGGGD